MVSYFFCLVNLKFLSRAMWISRCKKICRQKPMNMEKTHDFIIRPLKIWPLENVVNVIFLFEIHDYAKDGGPGEV